MMRSVFLGLASVAAVAALFWPGRGLVARWRRAMELWRRVRHEDALKHILKCEANGREATLESIAGALQITTGQAARLLSELETREFLTFEGGRLRLQPGGRDMALHVVQAHRLWESYLADQTGVAESEWHLRAEKQEHLLTPSQTQALAARLGHPTRDPHGDAIPGTDGAFADEPGTSLNAVPLETPAVITHVEDEPATVYRQLAALGLRPGMRVMVIERTAVRIRIRAEGNEHALAPVLAENVTVQPLPEGGAAELMEAQRLSELQPGGATRVVGLSPACRGPERRRLLDLGFVPGTLVEYEMASPTGDPTAYRVRAVVALRREQASLIRVRSPEGAAA